MRIFIACCGVLFYILSAQAQEVSVPLDTTGKIFVITLELENKLGLFPDYRGFIEARLYQAGDNEYFLEVLEQKDSSIVRKRIPQTEMQVTDLRKQVSRAISLRSPQTIYDHSGRAGLMVNSAILSAGYYGWVLPVVERVDNAKGPALYFLITGAGIMIPYLLTEKSNISRATAMMDFYGGSRGIVHGIALYYFFDPLKDRDREPLGWGMYVSLGERFALNQWAARTAMTEGKASVIGVGGDFGLVLGAALAAGHDLWNEEHQGQAGRLVLAGSALGMFAGSQFADHGHYTRGDGYVLRGLGILGAGIPASIGDATKQSDQTISALATGGAMVGLGIGHHLLQNKDFSSSQGLTVLLMEFGVATFGTAVMVILNDDGDSGPYAVAATVGGTLGFLLGYSDASRSARTIRKSADIDFQFNPLPLMTEIRQTDNPAADHRAKQALSLTYRF